MRVFFGPDLTGASHGFVWHDGQFAVGESAADWRFESDGLRYKCIRAASEAAGCDLVLTPDVPQARFWKKHTQHPAWSRILRQDEFRKHLADQIERVIEFLHDEESSYYLTHFQIQQKLLDALQPSRVAGDSLIDHGFVRDKSGFVAVPKYDNVHSSTGRMSITAGPKILTLQRGLRDSIISRWPDGEIIEIDYNALEARVLAWLAGNDLPDGDLYSWIGEKSGAKGVQRSVVKEATLAATYGMSKRNFALRYQDMQDAPEIYQNVRKILRVEELDARLASMPQLKNAFGRKLADTTSRVSHHVQSSAVDVACSGFLNLLGLIDSTCAVPIFLVHDAIVLDVRHSYLPDLEKICKSGLFVDMVGQHFPVKIGRLKNE
jgi:hypothetical protein